MFKRLNSVSLPWTQDSSQLFVEWQVTCRLISEGPKSESLLRGVFSVLSLSVASFSQTDDVIYKQRKHINEASSYWRWPIASSPIVTFLGTNKLFFQGVVEWPGRLLRCKLLTFLKNIAESCSRHISHALNQKYKRNLSTKCALEVTRHKIFMPTIPQMVRLE